MRSVAADTQVLQHRHGLRETKILVHEAHPVHAWLPRAKRQRDMASPNHERCSLVGVMKTGQDLDERRLSRTVLTEEAMDLPGSNVEVDRAQHGAARERLGEVRGRDDWRLVRHYRQSAVANRLPRVSCMPS